MIILLKEPAAFYLLCLPTVLQTTYSENYATNVNMLVAQSTYQYRLPASTPLSSM